MRQVGSVPRGPPARMKSNVFGETSTLCASCSGPEPEPSDAAARQDAVDQQSGPDPVRVDGNPPAGADVERTSDVGGDRSSTDPRGGARYAGRFCIAAEGVRLVEIDREQLGARRGANAGPGARHCGLDRRERENSVHVPRLEGPKHPEKLRLFGGAPYRDELVDRPKMRTGNLPDGCVHRVADHCGPGDDRRAEHRAEHDKSRLARSPDRIPERESPQDRPAH